MKGRITTFLTVLLTFSLAASANELPKEHVDAARNMAETVNEQLGSAEAIQKNAITPLTSDQKMHTLGRTSTFDADLMCQSASTFADLMIQPLSNGNIRIQSLRQDTNMDGSLDSYQTPGWTASAVCANGFMHCTDPRNPESCSSYRWVADGNNVVRREQVAMSMLGGCYCINQACGPNIVAKNMETVTGDIATGISGALAEKHPFFALTDISIDGFYAQLHGADGAACNPASPESVLGNPDVGKIASSNYVDNPLALNNDGFSAREKSPLYNLISNSANDLGFETRSCSITRIVEEDRVSLNDIISFDSGTGGIYPLGDDRLRIVLGQVGDNYWDGNCSYFTLNANFYVSRPDRIISAQLKEAHFDDWMQVHIEKDGNYSHIWNGPYGTWTHPTANVPGACELSTSWVMDNLNVDFKHALANQGRVRFRVRVEVSGSGEGYVLGEIRVNSSCKMKPDRIIDTCEIYRTNNKCTLLSEEVDGVGTIKNGHPTGLYPMPSYVGSFCGKEQERDWMQKSRTYRCESDYQTNFEAGLDRMEYVKSNSTLDRWHDRTQDPITGEIRTSSGPLTHFKGLGAAECTPMCKTRRPRPMNDMTISGVTGELHKDPVTYDIFYHQCTGANSNICPADINDEIIDQCQCLNEFSTVTAVMQSLRLAGQDMICTNGELEYPDSQ